jgi:transposase
MNYEIFENKIKDVGLNKKIFAENCNISYNTVMNWSNRGEVPGWVDSWIKNYKAKQDLDKIKSTLKETGVCDE